MEKKPKIIHTIITALIILVVVAIIAGIVFTFQTGRIPFKSLFSHKPARAGMLASDIIDYTIPANYDEVMEDAGVLRQISISEYGSGVYEKSGMMFILTILPTSGILEKETTRLEAQTTFMETRASQIYAMHPVEEGEATIRGQQVVLNSYSGRSTAGTPMKEIVSGLINGKQDYVILVVISTEDHWNQQMVDTFIQSIQ
jgi:hypothetical protein